MINKSKQFNCCWIVGRGQFTICYNNYFISVLRKAFEAFDSQKSGSIPCDMVADILRLMGQPFDKKILEELIEEVDADSKLDIIYGNQLTSFKTDAAC